MFTIKTKNSLVLEKNSLDTNCNYAQYSGTYYCNELQHVLLKRPEHVNYDNYICGKESTVKNKVVYNSPQVYNLYIKNSKVQFPTAPQTVIVSVPKIQKDKIESVNEKKPVKNNINIVATSKKKLVISKRNIYLTGWVNYSNDKKQLKCHNFGDDINFSFLTYITNCNHLLYKANMGRKLNFSMIGSTFNDIFINENTDVWGSGMLNGKLLTKKPHKVYAVRGPKTREVVMQSGIECPEIYGDPALLIPYYYYPYVQKKYKLGIIPHHSHIKEDVINKFKNIDGVTVIDFTSYTDWKNIIKQIVECDFIVSESLHGLIISEAYRIPNIWISFGDIGLNFKYEDYFLSIGKKPYESIIVDDNTTVEQLLELQKQYDPTFTLDLKKLVDACPIKLQGLNLEHNIKPYTGKVLLCCIGKMENNYIREFVEYHKQIGFDNICLYDNNDITGENFNDVIGDYINGGFVILKDWRGKKLAQIPAYTDCYMTYKNDYDWIAYIDIDEFIHLNTDTNIKEFLSKDIYNNRGINTIRICWKQFTDSGIIKTNNNYSVKKFTEVTTKEWTKEQTKVIVKTVLPSLEFTSPHGALTDTNVVCVNTKGVIVPNSTTIGNLWTWDNASLHHYRFKTIEEFVLNKMVRLWPTEYLNSGKTGLNLNMFFRFNTKTPEKVKYAEYLINKYKINRNEKV